MRAVFSVAEAARELGMSERWLRQADSKGRIPKARRNVNGWRVFTVEDIEVIRRLLLPAKKGEDGDTM